MDQIFPLKQIYFYLTEGCNLACRHCWLAPRYDPGLKNTISLPVELYQKVIQEASLLGLTGVKLTGGEPLLHPAFEKLLEITRQKDLSLAIETNGVLLTHELATKIADFPQRFVSISLDGADAVTHEAIRGVPGSFKKACQAVKMLAEVGIRPQIIFSVMRSNFHQMEQLIELAELLGASSVKFNLIQPTQRGENLHDQGLALNVDEYINLGKQVDGVYSKKTKLPVFYDYPPAFRPSVIYYAVTAHIVIF